MSFTQRTITYRTMDSIDLQMDIYAPEGTGTGRPGVLFFHGGGWSGGNRTQFTWHAQQLAERGYVAATASYRLCKAGPTYPAAFDDCQAAVRWLRKNGAELGLDPMRLGVVGSSAGGHLVALLGVRETRDDSDPTLQGVSSRPQCVVDIHGVHHLPSLHFPGIIKASAAFIGGDVLTMPDAWADASPLEFIDAKTPPTMLVHAPDDPSVPYDQSVRFAAALAEHHCHFTFYPCPGAGHGFIYDPGNTWTRRVWPLAVMWLEYWLTPRD
jgi:acetyl esterase/lipase